MTTDDREVTRFGDITVLLVVMTPELMQRYREGKHPAAGETQDAAQHHPN